MSGLRTVKEEYLSLVTSRTWQLVVPPKDSNIVSCKWTYKIKRDENGEISRYKARFVAKGFSQKYGFDFDEVFAPVGRQTTFRILLSIAGLKNMRVVHTDVKSAFLNGILNDTMYMSQTPGYQEGDNKLVCMLTKSLYGLKQAANVWNKTLPNVLVTAGFCQSESDACLYTKCINEEGIIYVLVYVDDISIASQNKDRNLEVEKLFAKEFEINNLGKFKYHLGMEVFNEKNNNFCIRQRKHIEDALNEFGLRDSKISSYLLDPAYGKNKSDLLQSNTQYQRLIGSLLYLSVNSRPDIAASVSILVRKSSNPTQEDWNEAKRVLKYIKGIIYFYLRLHSQDSRFYAPE